MQVCITWTFRDTVVSMAAFDIDTSNSRIWLIVFPANFTTDEYEGLLLRSMKLNPTRERIVVMMDMRTANLIEGEILSRRDEMAAVVERYSEWCTESLVAAVRITSDAMNRGVLTVYDSIHPTPWPRKEFGRGDAAEAWARQQLEEAGIDCDPEPVWRE